jgi:hypothetical protein
MSHSPCNLGEASVRREDEVARSQNKGPFAKKSQQPFLAAGVKPFTSEVFLIRASTFWQFVF